MTFVYPLFKCFLLFMAFQLYRGRPQIKFYPKTASTVLVNGGVGALSSGQLIKATTLTLLHPGVILRDVVSTDSDYASTTFLPVMVPNDDTEFTADVGSGVFTAALVGTTCDLAAGGDTIAASTNVHQQVTITGFISSTKAIVKINSNIAYKNAS